MMSYSKKLKKLRKSKGLTQIQLSELAKVSQSTICEIEKNEYVPKIAITVKLANALQLPVTSLDPELEKNIKAFGGTLLQEEELRQNVSLENNTMLRIIELNKNDKIESPLDSYAFNHARHIIYFPNSKKGDFVIKLCEKNLCDAYPANSYLLCRDGIPSHGKIVAIHMKSGEVEFGTYTIVDKNQYLKLLTKKNSKDIIVDSEDIRKIWCISASMKPE